MPTSTPVRADKKAGADTQSVVDTSSTPVPPALPTAPAAASAGGRYAFLLMGYGGGSHDGAYLTDSLMVVIVDPAQKSLTLLSIPRDYCVTLPFYRSQSSY